MATAAAAKPPHQAPPLMAPVAQNPAISNNIHALTERTSLYAISPAASASVASPPSTLLLQQQQAHANNASTTAQQATAPGHEAGYFNDPTVANTVANSHSEQNHQQQAHSSSLRPTKFTEEWDATQRGSSIIDGANKHNNMQRSSSFSGSAGGDRESIQLPQRGNTLKKKASLRRSGSRSGGGTLSRSGSRRSMKAGSVRSLALQSGSDPDETHNAFYCPVPTSGNPTEALAVRFTSWRKVLKDLITYFREIQTHYDHRAKSLVKLANVLNNTNSPAGMLSSGGLDDALQILRAYNSQAIAEAQKAREIEEDVILSLTGLRSDLQQKIKEIKGLSGDFKNSVDREIDATRKAVKYLQEHLGQSDMDSSLTTGKQDPYILRLAVDRQLARQLEEENYLHQAYLNLENSGRELESIVVGEIQKSYKAYAGILTRESDNIGNTVDELRTGPIAMPKDHEWMSFVKRDDQFVDPDVPVRQIELIHYPGRDHHAAQEIRAGLLERKSKYLKSYTAGWYVLSPTHLHEFKSADKTQAPIMSLYLPEQKLGSHSTDGSSSNKFILKGRQTGSMHRGHTWVFRAESHDTMMAWYDDIKALTDSTPAERSEFVRGHSRSFSRSSQRSISSDGADQHDEADDVPFDRASEAASTNPAAAEQVPTRPSPGGRFPSDLQVNAQRGLLSPDSDSVGSEVNNRETGPNPVLLQQQQQGYYTQQQPQQQQHQNPRMSSQVAIAAAAGLPGSQIGQHPDGQYGAGGMVNDRQPPGQYADGGPVSGNYGQHSGPGYQNYAPSGMQTLSNYMEQPQAPTPNAQAPQHIQGTGSAAPIAVNGDNGGSWGAPPPPQQPYTTQEAFGMRDSIAGEPSGLGYYAAAGAAGGAMGAGMAHQYQQQQQAQTQPRQFQPQQQQPQGYAQPQEFQPQPQQAQPDFSDFQGQQKAAMGAPIGVGAMRVNSSSTFGHGNDAYQNLPLPVPGPSEKEMNGAAAPMMSGAGGAAQTTERPAVGPRADSEAPTISHLHIPGEYPKGTPQL